MPDVTPTPVQLRSDGATATLTATAFAAGDTVLAPAVVRGGVLVEITSTAVATDPDGTVTVHRSPTRIGSDPAITVAPGAKVAIYLREGAGYDNPPRLSANFAGNAIAYAIAQGA